MPNGRALVARRKKRSLEAELHSSEGDVLGQFRRRRLRKRARVARNHSDEISLPPTSAYCYCAGAAGASTLSPIASPFTTSSTRRFFCRPSAVSFDAIGFVLP